MSKLVIISPTIGPKGKHLSRGDEIDIDDAKDVYALISAGRALDVASKQSEDQEAIKAVRAEVEAAKKEEAKAKAKAEKA